MENFAEKVIGALNSLKVEFIVVGGVSAILHGVPIVTWDLDMCYRRNNDNLRRLTEALARFICG